MPKNVCFYVCDRAGSDISQKDQNLNKTGKNEHESGTSQKVVAGFQSSQRKAQNIHRMPQSLTKLQD